jgi:GTP cyclohydrolase IA
MATKRTVNAKKMEEGVRLLLQGMGVDLADENFRDTPRRVAAMYRELFSRPKFNFATFPAKYRSMVIVRGHKCYCVCPHHLLPVELRVYIGYIPHLKVVGLSKLARAAEAPLVRPIMQEEYTDELADILKRELDPTGVAVVVQAAHGCMRCRGIKTDADVVTSAMHGVFMTVAAAREEFMKLLELGR